MKNTVEDMKKKKSSMLMEANYWTLDGEQIRSDSPMVKKSLTEIIEACENMSHYYEDYLALGRNICENLSFGDNIYFK